MSDLTTYPELEQRSLEWFDARRGIVTASAVGSLLTTTLKVADNETSRSYLRTLVAERITGRIIETRQTDAMLTGILDEPIARDIYREHFNPVREFGFFVRDLGNGAKLGYSPDGLVGGDGLVEIKSATTTPKTQIARALGAPVEHAYMAQMQAGMLVTGRKWCDFVSYSGGMPLHVKRIEADPDWHGAILAAVDTFEERAQEMERAYSLATEGMPATELIDHFETPELKL
ncbi:lambda exonuclease family protein [Demequina globuliformis]|uniref:lambda exonuclease family protein n=1 Tax=Demequina globuliformis TaxID=676202 RepID=UPI000780327E|nr:lambda exonuclease family protein [Demequina globuliformis]